MIGQDSTIECVFENVGNYSGMPTIHSLRGFSTSAFQFIFDLAQTPAIQIQIKYQPDSFCLLRIDDKVHFLCPIRQNLLNPVVPQNIAVTIVHAVIHRGLLTALDADGSLTAFVLRQGCHDGEPKLTITVKGFDTVVYEVHLHAMLFQHSGILQSIHRVSGEPGYLAGQDHVKPVLFCIFHHPHKLRPFFSGCASDAFINIPFHQSPFRVQIQQRLVPI